MPKKDVFTSATKDINAALQRQPSGQSHITMGNFLQNIASERRKFANFSIFVSYVKQFNHNPKLQKRKKKEKERRKKVKS